MEITKHKVLKIPFSNELKMVFLLRLVSAYLFGSETPFLTNKKGETQKIVFYEKANSSRLNSLGETLSSHVKISCNPVKCKCINVSFLFEFDSKVYEKNINNAYSLVISDLHEIINFVNLNIPVYEDKCFSRKFLLFEDYYGSYDFDTVKIDFGTKLDKIGSGKDFTLLFNYQYIPSMKTKFGDVNRIDNIVQMDIYLTAILQWILRTKIVCSRDFSDFDYLHFSFASMPGPFTRYPNDVASINNFHCSSAINEGIDLFANEKINMFLSLPSDKQQIFFHACNEYSKIFTSNLFEAIVHLTICFEILAFDFSSNKKQKPVDMIKDLLDYFFPGDGSIKNKIVKYYDIRSNYAHCGYVGDDKVSLIYSPIGFANSESDLYEKYIYIALNKWLKFTYEKY